MSAAPPDPFAVPTGPPPASAGAPAWDPGWGWTSPAPRVVDVSLLPRRSVAIGNRAGFAKALLVLAACASLFLAYAIGVQRSVLGAIDSARTAGDISDHLIQRAYDSDSLTKAAVIVLGITFLVSAVAFIAWHRSIDGAARDLQLDPEVSSRWVIWGWIVPFVSLVMPFRSMRDLSAKLRSTAASRVMLLWWVLFIFASVVARFTYRGTGDGSGDDDISSLRTDDVITILCCATLVLSAGLAFYIVVQLSRTARERLLEAAAAPAAESAAG